MPTDKQGLKMDLQFFADDPAPNDPVGDVPNDGGDNNPEGGQDPQDGGKDYEKIIAELRKENAKWRTKLREKESHFESKLKELTNNLFSALGLEPDPNKNYEAQIAELAKQRDEALQKANERILRSEAKAIAASIGVAPDKFDYVYKLADLSDVPFDDDGNPDADAIKKAIEKVVNDIPGLVEQAKPAQGGGEFNTGGGGQGPVDLATALRKYFGR